MNSGTDFENAVKFLNGSSGPSSEDSVPQRVFKAGSGPRKQHFAMVSNGWHSFCNRC